MPDLLLIVYLLGGLVALALAGDALVNGAVTVARQIGVSPLLAGVLLVGFGTSAPELIVALNAAASGYPELALGNIVGSNIANVWLVLALPALITPIAAGGFGQRPTVLIMLAVTALWIFLMGGSGLSAAIGSAFLLGLAAYAVIAILMLRNAPEGTVSAPEGGSNLPLAIAFLVVGLVGLPVGAHFIVEGGVGIARFYNVSEELIGLTLLAVGTSLPEIGAGVAAALRKNTDVLVGNVLGSNIFNILGAGGLVSLFGTVTPIGSFQHYDHWAMGAAALWLALLIFTRSKVSRLAAIAMLLLYAVYIYGLVNGWNISAAIGFGDA